MMDEPAAGLSDAELMELDSLIKQLQPRYGVSSILLVEHHVDLVMRLCSRVIVLDFGQKIAEGTPQAIQSNEAVIAAYLGDEKRTRRMPETGDT
jgi:branched-chain amino acid transport system ATP-binding protein